MLMLTRRKGEAVDIYDKKGNIVVTVQVTEFLPGNVVRLGFAASNEYTILRDNAKSRSPRGDADSSQHEDAAETKSDSPSITYKRRRGADE